MDDVLVDRIDSARGADVVLPERPIAKHASGGRLTGLRIAETGANPEVQIGDATKALKRHTAYMVSFDDSSVAVAQTDCALIANRIAIALHGLDNGRSH